MGDRQHWRRRATEGEEALHGGAGSNGHHGRAAAQKAQPGAHADRLGFGVAAGAACFSQRAGKAEELGEFVHYVKWTGRRRGGRSSGPHLFRDVVRRVGRPQSKGPEIEQSRWRRMLQAALPGTDLDDPGDMGGRPMMQVLSELLQREGRYRRKRRQGAGEAQGGSSKSGTEGRERGRVHTGP